MDTPPKITVIVPLFPRHPALRRSLASLRTQTVPPDLVVLVDNGTSPEAESLAAEVPELPVSIAQAETLDPADGINRAVEFLEQSEFVSILAAGATYEPTRFERCLAAMRNPESFRVPGLTVTGVELVDSLGEPLAPEDPRHAQLDRVWGHGRGGVFPSEWLAAGDFVLAASNLFARRSYLAANPLPVGTAFFAYLAAVQAAVQNLLVVIDEPLIALNWPGPDNDPSAPATAALLHAQFAMLSVLREKIAASPETRRNVAAFRRAAWNNISGLREDLFTQATMLLASHAEPLKVAEAIERLGGARDFIEPPAYLRDFRAGEASADPAAYAAALTRVRAELEALREEHRRVLRVAEAAQESGWVRFGAWLGDTHARRIMEMDEETEASVQPPDGKVEGGGEDHPDEVGNKEP